MRSAIDANIVLYAFADNSDSRKTGIARDLLRQLAEANECVISTQVLKEFANVCTKRLRPIITREALLERLERLAELDLVVVDARITASAVSRHFASKISFYDSLIVEAALAGGAAVLYSEDLQHGMRFDTLQVLNPFVQTQ
jgi:predicted nucleic acid-binding protein